MAQNKIKIDGVEIKQPAEGLGYSFETQYTSDSARVQSGELHTTPIFTVESLSYSASFLSKTEMRVILQLIAKGNRFSLTYFSPYHGTWRTDTFYVPKGSVSIGRLNEGTELFDSLSFEMIGVNPI